MWSFLIDEALNKLTPSIWKHEDDEDEEEILFFHCLARQPNATNVMFVSFWVFTIYGNFYKDHPAKHNLGGRGCKFMAQRPPKANCRWFKDASLVNLPPC